MKDNNGGTHRILPTHFISISFSETSCGNVSADHYFKKKLYMYKSGTELGEQEAKMKIAVN